MAKPNLKKLEAEVRAFNNRFEAALKRDTWTTRTLVGAEVLTPDAGVEGRKP